MCALAVGLSGCASSEDDQVVGEIPSASPTAEESAAPEPEKDTETEAAAEPEVEAPSQREGLDAYVAAEQQALAQADEQLLAMYEDITVEAIDPGTVSFSYIFAEPLDIAVAAGQFDTTAADLQELCDTQVFPAMKSMGVTESPKVVYTYLNPDGAQIWSQTFEPS